MRRPVRIPQDEQDHRIFINYVVEVGWFVYNFRGVRKTILLNIEAILSDQRREKE
jgi:hypothetical protein